MRNILECPTAEEIDRKLFKLVPATQQAWILD